MARHVPGHWFGVKGKSICQAVWTRSVHALDAAAKGLVSMAFLYDIEKAFDNVEFSFLIDSAIDLDFPIDLLLLLIDLYQRPRYVSVGKGVVTVAMVLRSAIAGESFADLMMLLLMIRIDKNVRQDWPLLQLSIAVVADDYQILLSGRLSDVVAVAPKLHKSVCDRFLEVGLPPSAKKFVALASTPALKSALAASAPRLAKG